LLLGIAGAAVLAAGVLSSLASAKPDGLEWAAGHASGGALAEPEGQVHRLVARLQRATALLPDYESPARSSAPGARVDEPGVRRGTAVAGLVGTFATLALAYGLGAVVRARRRPR
jgi:cobalt/nickel transport system permease protein